MTVEDYQRNLRGMDEGGNFEPDYLVSTFKLFFTSSTDIDALILAYHI